MIAQSIDLVAGAAHVVLLPALGGSIRRFTIDERAILRPMPDDAIAARNVRLTGCFPLVPYSNRIRNASLTFCNRQYVLARNFGDHPHAIHGVGWQREWTVQCASTTSATLALDHHDDASAWPWPFRALQTFDVAARDDAHVMLTVTLTIENTGGEAFPFGLGWHPYFPRDASTALQFAADGVWINDATGIPVEHIAAEEKWSLKQPRRFGGSTIDNVFTQWNGRATLSSMQSRLVTTIEADSSCNRLVVYVPEGRDFVAIEPATHDTDAFNRAAAGAQHTGMRMLAPGASYSCTIRIAATSQSR